MATTEYALFDDDCSGGYVHNGIPAEWRCGVCRRADGEDADTDEAGHYITVCEHMVRGDDTYDGDTVEFPRSGAVAVWRTEHRDGPTSWMCEDDECGEVALCHDCWSNL